ncbi:MAG: serine O-acetyltransferase [Hyphomicrobiales bacterium]|nr:serine O-acetyltransferase [Hyphomicrobiales bacterium]
MPQNNNLKTNTEELSDVDPIWDNIRAEAKDASSKDPMTSSFMYSLILGQKSLENVLSLHLSKLLETISLEDRLIKELFDEFYSIDSQIKQVIRADISAVYDRDPACHRYLEPVIYFKGFQALQTHRLANWLWTNNRNEFAYYLQSISSRIFSVDIHPAAKFGRGIFIDHATGIVIGETAEVDDNVSMLHDVTLGGTGKKCGDRHPKIKSGVLIGAGAKILGNIDIGVSARIAAGSVVLHDVPDGTTVAGVPAKVIANNDIDFPSQHMDHLLPSHDSNK